MLNKTILVKLQQRLDKLGSQDYGNIEQWMLVEAFNKGQMSWIRRQIEGINQTRTGAEGSTRRIDDLQFILNTAPVNTSSLIDYGNYWSFNLPDNYFEWCRVSGNAVSDCCPPRPLTIWPTIEADLDINLKDTGKQPTFDWSTTFATLSNKQVKIYTNGEFNVQDVTFTYYRYPNNIQVLGVVDPYTGNLPTAEVLCEATDNVVELMIEEAVSIISRDLKDYQMAQIATQNNEKNN